MVHIPPVVAPAVLLELASRSKDLPLQEQHYPYILREYTIPMGPI
jgi:hypothetical protein